MHQEPVFPCNGFRIPPCTKSAKQIATERAYKFAGLKIKSNSKKGKKQ